MKVKFNSPTTLSFTFVCLAVLIIDQLFFKPFVPEGTMNPFISWFVAPSAGTFDFASFKDYFRLFTHAIGHADIAHFLSNFSFILLLGPILEQTYGSLLLLGMMCITALVTGLLNALFFPTGLLGASGIVFMMILLSSFTNFAKDEIPLTFILVMILWLGKEVWNSFSQNQISEFAHIVGGLCGGIFGFIKPSAKKAPKASV